ncbi:hypothetical protein JTB14_029211 [Gonioctena quinquepunctata]|nr:hypothetical protein JTB14_029211 [Gonioctena quinquepunctata]
MLSHDIVSDLEKYTNMYAVKQNKPNCHLLTDEMYVFIGILLLSGYWGESENVPNKLVSLSMRRNRFEEICSVLHAADNDNLLEGDELGKIRPLIERINQNFIRYALIEPNISIDESMIPHYRQKWL